MIFIPIAMTVIFCLLIVFSGEILDAVHSRSPNKKLKAKPETKVSWVGQQIIDAYNKLPDSNRPYANIEYLVRALDVKHNREVVNDHFKGWLSRQPSMGCDCIEGPYSLDRGVSRCPHRDYREMYNSIDDIATELRAQEHALEVAGIQDGLDQIAEFRSALLQETKLIKQTTKEVIRRW